MHCLLVGVGSLKEGLCFVSQFEEASEKRDLTLIRGGPLHCLPVGRG